MSVQKSITMFLFFLTLFIGGRTETFLSAADASAAAPTSSVVSTPWQIVFRDDVAQVWSGNPVTFEFLQKDSFIFAAFYDGNDKKMVVGKKNLSDVSSPWEFKKLETAIGWDSHNYIRMTFDRSNCLHLCGNMHCVPLIYYRAAKPLDIQSLEAQNRMLAPSTSLPDLQSARESRCTYPHFLKNADGALIFGYRDGSSGNGSQIWNIYDEKTCTWSRLLDVPMFDGEGKCNAYYQGPTLGPDGFYHMAWVWRDTPDCATNHDLSYMRSRDLTHWEKSDGSEQILPVTRSNSEVVAALQPGEGLLNPLVALGFDAEQRVIISYSRYDEQKNNQLMQARLENEGWKHYQTSDWTHSWIFSGGGCIPTELSFSEISCLEDGTLVQFWNRKYETSGKFVLDSETLKPVRRAPAESALPPECLRCENPQENQVQKRFSVEDSKNPNQMFLFVWETFPVNRDRPYETAPNPSTLRMFLLKRE